MGDVKELSKNPFKMDDKLQEMIDKLNKDLEKYGRDVDGAEKFINQL